MTDIEIYKDTLSDIGNYISNFQFANFIPLQLKLDELDCIFTNMQNNFNNLTKDEQKALFRDIESIMIRRRLTVTTLRNIVYDRLYYTIKRFKEYCDRNTVEYGFKIDIILQYIESILNGASHGNGALLYDYITYFRLINSTKDLICITFNLSIFVGDACKDILDNAQMLACSIHDIIEGRISIIKTEVEH